MKIKDIFYTNDHEISVHFVWFYIIFLILGGWVVNNFFQIEELFVIVLLLPLFGLIFYSNKKTKEFTNDNFPLFLELKKSPASFISLKQQEIFLNEFARNAGVSFNKQTKTQIFPEKFTINDVEFFYFKELERIESERKSLEQSGEMEFQKQLISLYEAQHNNYGYLSENEEKIIKFFLWAGFYIGLCYLIQIEFFIFAPIVIFIVVMIFGSEDWKYISNLSEDFGHGEDFMYSYFDKFYGQYLHPADILLFADVMNYFSENILQRNKNIMENEKNFSKKYFFKKSHDKIQDFSQKKKLNSKMMLKWFKKLFKNGQKWKKFILKKKEKTLKTHLY